MAMIEETAERVPRNTAEEVNERIRRATERSISYYTRHPEAIEARLRELDREWDVERMIEANAATLALTGVVLGASDRRWLALSGLVTGFLLQHAIQGWCPPVPILRRLGFRTAKEIAQERYALKALRGDFSGVAAAQDKLMAVLSAVGLRRRTTVEPSSYRASE